MPTSGRNPLWPSAALLFALCALFCASSPVFTSKVGDIVSRNVEEFAPGAMATPVVAAEELPLRLEPLAVEPGLQETFRERLANRVDSTTFQPAHWRNKRDRSSNVDTSIVVAHRSAERTSPTPSLPSGVRKRHLESTPPTLARRQPIADEPVTPIPTIESDSSFSENTLVSLQLNSATGVALSEERNSSASEKASRPVDNKEETSVLVVAQRTKPKLIAPKSASQPAALTPEAEANSSNVREDHEESTTTSEIAEPRRRVGQRLAARPRLFSRGPLLGLNAPRNFQSPVEPTPRPALPSSGSTAKDSSPAAIWVAPRALLTQLEEYSFEPSLTGIHQQMLAIEQQAQLDVATLERELAILEQLLAQAEKSTIQVDPRQQPIWRVLQGVRRRLELWQIVTAIQKSAPSLNGTSQLAEAAHAVDQSLGTHPHRSSWIEYLSLDELKSATNGSVASRQSPPQIENLTSQVIARFENHDLTAEQKTLLSEPAFAQLYKAANSWQARQLEMKSVLKAVEAYELSGRTTYGDRILQYARLLQHSSERERQQLAAVLVRHYHEANLRVTLSRKLVQRLLPAPTVEQRSVNDTIAGSPVRGRSFNSTQLQVVFIPDDSSWRIGLEAHGQVVSNTASDNGPARFHSAGNTNFVAKKLVLVSPEGLYTFPAVAGADADTTLRGIDTSFDGIPLVGGLVRSIAINQHDKSKQQVKYEVEGKVASRAKAELDQQADERFHQAAGRAKERLITPFERLGLDLQPVELSTSKERLTMQVRVGDGKNAGAHAPRPYAPADSLASMQFHQSILNNAAAALQLAGNRFTLPQLYRAIAGQMGHSEPQIPQDMSTTAEVEFAERDPIQIRLDDGRVKVTFALAEIKEGRTRLTNFYVHAWYRPQVNGLQAGFIRDGALEIQGKRLRPADHLLLQSVFVKFFSDRQSIPVLHSKIAQDERLAGTMVTQFVVDDGWMALALGPSHPQRIAQSYQPPLRGPATRRATRPNTP